MRMIYAIGMILFGVHSSHAVADSSQRVCGALRGNGERVLAHFHSLAGYIEAFDAPDMLSGSSSGALSIFLYESMLLNPHLGRCGEEPCDSAQKNARLAFMLKSTLGILEALKSEPLGKELIYWLKLGQGMAKSGKNASGKTLLENDFFIGLILNTILKSKYLISLIDPVYLDWLKPSKNPNVQNVRQRHTLDAIKFYYKPEFPPEVFFRRVPLNFSEIIRNVGSFADFYAGYGDHSDDLGQLLASCADDTKGLSWLEISARTNCELTFLKVFSDFRKKNKETPPQRLRDPMGQYFPALTLSGYVDNSEAIDDYRDLDRAFQQGQAVHWQIGANDLKVGVFHSPDIRFEMSSSSPKWRLYRNLASTRWQDVLMYATAEPGGANLPWSKDGKTLYLGGWVEPIPVKLLKSAGCDKVIYFTREGKESKHPPKVMASLGFSPAEIDQWFSQDLEQSATYQAMSMTNAFWCTRWDDFGLGNIKAMVQDSYDSPLVTTDQYFLQTDNGDRIVSEGSLGCDLK